LSKQRHVVTDPQRQGPELPQEFEMLEFAPITLAGVTRMPAHRRVWGYFGLRRRHQDHRRARQRLSAKVEVDRHSQKHIVDGARQGYKLSASRLGGGDARFAGRELSTCRGDGTPPAWCLLLRSRCRRGRRGDVGDGAGDRARVACDSG